MNKFTKGFTIIELLVVISIVAYLSTAVISSVEGARIKARDTLRIQNLRQLQLALEAYYLDYGQYPQTFNNADYPNIYDSAVGWGESVNMHANGGYNNGMLVWWSDDNQMYEIWPVKSKHCNNGNSPPIGLIDYISGLAPKYISVLPGDIALDCAGVPHSWAYSSDGVDYKLIMHPENATQNSLVDPGADGGPSPCVVDNIYIVHYGVWTNGAKCWRM